MDPKVIAILVLSALAIVMAIVVLVLDEAQKTTMRTNGSVGGGAINGSWTMTAEGNPNPPTTLCFVNNVAHKTQHGQTMTMTMVPLPGKPNQFGLTMDGHSETVTRINDSTLVISYKGRVVVRFIKTSNECH